LRNASLVISDPFLVLSNTHGYESASAILENAPPEQSLDGALKKPATLIATPIFRDDRFQMAALFRDAATSREGAVTDFHSRSFA
jgi:hypothetical protein